MTVKTVESIGDASMEGIIKDHVEIIKTELLDLQPGDVLLIKVGGEIGGGVPPWIPSEVELEYTREVFQAVVPDDVAVLTHHHLIQPTVIRGLGEGNEVVVEKSGGASAGAGG